jgi:ATP-dependent Clp protease, protease subunit
MPVGVPKVAYELVEDEPAEWIDLYNALYRERTLFLCQDLNEELANQLMGIMLYINTQPTRFPKTDDVVMYINSPGGEMVPGVGVHDVSNFIAQDVHTICIGVAASITSFVLVGGTMGKRTATPNARMMIHQPTGGSDGQMNIVLSEAQEVLRLQEAIIKTYAKITGQTIERIKRDIKRDEFMSPHEARTYGLIDQVGADR